MAITKVAACEVWQRELLAMVYREGKILGWWCDREHGCFCVHLPNDRTGRVPVARLAEVLTKLSVRPQRGVRQQGARLPAHERRNVDL